MGKRILDDQEKEILIGYVLFAEIINRTGNLYWVIVPLLTELIDNANLQ
jgi:hypothetical protein